ncbi:MAG: radical SAM protein [Erysipelotrichaceae bacterium]|nr:radical SAM protein [Erysipelotrichaceae bacterium]
MTTRIKHLYVHVPFCSSICYYCDFCHRIYDKKLAEQWLETLKKEIQTSCSDFYETIYIGGGTPTVLSLDQLRRLLEMISEFADKVKEYTIEVNPESLDEDKILLFKEYGINRISMGVQSSNDRILSSLNRKHSFADVKDKIVLLKKHDLSNISVDLMYSLPDQTMEILDQSIEDILSLDVPHISLYAHD